MMENFQSFRRLPKKVFQKIYYIVTANNLHSMIYSNAYLVSPWDLLVATK